MISDKETPEKNTHQHNTSPNMDYACRKRQPPSRGHQALIISGAMGLMIVLIIGLVSYIDDGRNSAHGSEVEAGTVREIPSPGYPGSHVPEEQLSMANEDVLETLVVQEQEGQHHARSYTEEQVAERNNFARRYTKEEQMAERDAVVHGQGPPPFRLPRLPIPSDILDIPIKIPTHISDILGDLPVPTIPTDPGDIVDVLPTDPGEIISDIIPIPTLPVPVPTIPTEIPKLPIPTGTEIPKLPIPTVLPPSEPRDPGDGFHLPDLIQIPHKILGLLHHSIAQLSNDENLPRPIRDFLRLILRIIERLVGGHPVPKPPKPPKPTISLPIPTGTKLPIPTLPIPTLPEPTLPEPTLPTPTLPTGEPTRRPLFPPRPRPTLTLPVRAKKARSDSGGDGKEPLSDRDREMLRKAVSDEVWSSADWSSPIVAPIMATAAMAAFDAIYLVAEASKRTEDEGEREKLLDLLVVVDDGDEEAMA